MSRATALTFSKFATMVLAAHSWTVQPASAADGDSARCMAVRRHCENGDASCAWLLNALTEDGIVCPVTEAAAVPESVRCMAVRHLCEDSNPACASSRKELADDGVVCASISAPSEPARSVGAVTDQEYGVRCEKALAACRDGDATCARWRDAFNEHGSVCPGVNASLTATRKGPTGSPNPASYVGAATAPTSSDKGKLFAGDTLGKLQTECDAAHGYRAFSAEVKCVENGIRVSQDFSAKAVSEEIHLYTLTAENLVDEVGRKSMSSTAARVELQKAFLEFRDRLNRQNAETAAKEEAARLQAQQIAASAQAAREQENQRLLAAQAAAEDVQRAQDQEAQRAAQQAALEQVREQCREGMQINHNGINYAGLAQCDADPYAYARIKHINCSGNGTNQISCTEQ